MDLRWVKGPLVAMAMLASPVAAVAEGDLSPSTLARIDHAARQRVETGAAPGVAVQVMKDGRVVFSRAYGRANLELDVATTPESVFRIASNTKSFTAASVLMLADRGLLSLDDTVARHLPDFPGADRITIRQLLTHTSGLITYDETYRGTPELAVVRTNPEMIALISGLEPLNRFAPGQAYQYSNSGYYLLGAIVERLSGQTLGQFMAENIFTPLELRHTAMDDALDVVPQRAAGYEAVPGQPGQFRNAPFVPYTAPGPGGGLRSTVGDLVRWYDALFSGRVVSQAMLAEMTAPARLSDGRLASQGAWPRPGAETSAPLSFEVGLGVRLSERQGRRSYWHTGAIEGFTSQLRFYPDDKIIIAVLTNAYPEPDGLFEAVERAVLDLETDQ
jgi:D-alanyl-D-alanine carboxypeptidase